MLNRMLNGLKLNVALMCRSKKQNKKAWKTKGIGEYIFNIQKKTLNEENESVVPCCSVTEWS